MDFFHIGSRVEVAQASFWVVGAIADIAYSQEDGEMVFCEVAYDSKSSQYDPFVYTKRELRPIQPIEADRVFLKGEIVEILIDGIWFKGEVLKFSWNRGEYSVKRTEDLACNVGRKRKRVTNYDVGVNFIRPPKSWSWITGSWTGA